MTNNEKRLASALLEMAADEFINHGCNDFHKLVEIIPDRDDRAALIREVDKWEQLRLEDVELTEFRERCIADESDDLGCILTDYQLMCYLSAKLLPNPWDPRDPYDPKGTV